MKHMYIQCTVDERFYIEEKILIAMQTLSEIQPNQPPPIN